MAATADAARLGREAAAKGQLGAAIRHFRAALDHAPGDPAITVWLGQALCATGHLFEGTRHLREGAVARIAAGAPPADLLPLAHLLQTLGEPAGALAVLEELARRDLDTAPLWQATATAAAQLARHDLALEACSKALHHAPETAHLHVLTASIEIDAGQARQAAARLDGVLAAAPAPRERMRAHRERARARDRLGRWREVFDDLADSAVLAPALPEYAAQDAGLVARLIGADMAGFDAAMVDRWRHAAPADDGAAPVFLIGYLRSGTTLMQEVMACAPGVLVADEAPLLSGTQAAYLPGPSRLQALDALTPDAVAALRARYRRLAAMRLGPEADARRLVDKFALNVIDLPVILRLFPEARIVFMVRDPRDVCLSSMLQLMPPSPSTVNLLRWDDAARFHALVTGAWRRWRDALGLQPCEVRYEALVDDLEGTMRAVLPPLGLAWSDAMRDFHKSAATRAISTPSRSQVTRPLNRASVQRWRSYEPEFASVQSILAPALGDWGY
ncbi:sulfotransferase [Novosphingobium resinovorum]|uniref:tetratricopeptide repeat-containing sulfotransferase family protein n=1 Tax=Novosphingobium resinovorum TaxID=158500 RepID=UPI002ED4C78C|nr:sulfotransferase [Novosphingobium resinovorum]